MTYLNWGADKVKVIVLFREIPCKRESSKKESWLIFRHSPILNGVRSNKQKAAKKIADFWKSIGVYSYVNNWGKTVNF